MLKKLATVLAVVLRMALGGVFLLAGISKVFAMDAFVDVVRQIGFVPPQIDSMVAFGIANAEIVLALTLLSGRFSFTASFLACVALACFTVVSLILLYREQPVECACFVGIYQRKVGLRSVVENLLLLAAAVYICVFSYKLLYRPAAASQAIKEHGARLSGV